MPLTALFAIMTAVAPLLDRSARNPDPRHIVESFCLKHVQDARGTHVYSLRNGGKVVFVAVDHAVDATSDADRSSTRHMIMNAFDEYRPDFVLIEGTSKESTRNAEFRKLLIEKSHAALADQTIQENMFALVIAADRDIDFSGWDLSPRDEYRSDLAAGYTVEDAIGAHLLRERYNPFTISPDISAAINRQIRYIPPAKQPPIFDFESWYRKTYGNNYDKMNGTPCGVGVASEIVNYESIMRTENLANLIDTHTLNGKTLLVEGGSAHWAALRSYLDTISKRLAK